MFTKIAIENIEKGNWIIASGEYKTSNWTTPKLRGFEIVEDPVFVDNKKRALITYRDNNGNLADGCLKTVNDNGWDMIILVASYDKENDKPTDFGGEIVVPAIVKNMAAGEPIAGALLRKQSIESLAEFKQHHAVVMLNDTFGAMLMQFDDSTEFINTPRGDGTQEMDIKLHHLALGYISNWRVMKYESEDTPVIFPASENEFGIPELIFKVVSLTD